jgi:hypothetical protein
MISFIAVTFITLNGAPNGFFESSKFLGNIDDNGAYR